MPRDRPVFDLDDDGSFGLALRFIHTEFRRQGIARGSGRGLIVGAITSRWLQSTQGPGDTIYVRDLLHHLGAFGRTQTDHNDEG